MKKTLLLIVTTLLVINIFAQDPENNLSHEMWYSSYDQNMWGPDWAYGIDVDYSIFDFDIDESWGFTEIQDILGMQLGIGFQIGIQALLSSTFEAHGFYTGEFDLDYPILTHLDFPAHETFDYGGPTTIFTDFEVTDGWDLSTEFPPVGVITLDFEYMFNPFMDIIVCVFGCDTIHIIPPSVQVPYTLDTLFHIDAENEYAIFPCYVGDQFQFCHDYELPIDVDFTDLVGFNFEAHVDLPYVETEDYIQEETNCLIAQGDSMYLFVHLDLIGFLYQMAGYIPPPDGPQIQEAIALLNGTIEYPFSTSLGDVIFQIEYSLLQAELLMRNYLHQDIYFCPTIWGTFSFPTELEYEINDPGGNSVETGYEDSITMAIGNDLTITYPCHGVEPYEDSMYVGVQYNIQPTIRNHTWDSMSFAIGIEVLSVCITVDIPFFKMYNDVEMPEFVLPVQELSSINTPQKSPAIPMDPYVELAENMVDEEKLGPWCIGPLFEWEIPLGYIPLTWFDETWELEHFQEDLVFPGTHIKPLPKSEVNVLLYSAPYCYGDPYSYVNAQAQNGIPPFDFIWSTGEIHENINNDTDSIFAPPGFYTVTIVDQYGCEAYDSMSVTVNPPLMHSLEAQDILCHGHNTGVVQTEVSGGTPPYFFSWSPSGSESEDPSNLHAGWHTVTITDWAGCSIIDSVFIDQPESPLTIISEGTNVQCHGYTNGSIDVSVSGATPPYNYLWSNGAITQDLHNIPAGTYTLSVTDHNGCLWTDITMVTEPDTLISMIIDTDITCFGDNDGTITVSTNGGNPPYNYTWFHNPTINTPELENLPPGFYMVSVTDENNCSDTVSTYITTPDELIVNIETEHISCYGMNDGIIYLDIQGGVPNYLIDWSHGFHNDTIQNLFPGTYTVTVTDQHACNKIHSIEIIEPERLSNVFTNITEPSCFGFDNASATSSPEGGTPPYEVVWQDGVIQDGFTGSGMLANEYYFITITDFNGCTRYDSISFGEPDLLVLSGTTEPVICGETPGSANITPQGGTSPYAYIWSNGETSSTPTDLQAGIVSVTVTDSQNCIDSLELFVEHQGSLTGTAEVISPNPCYNDSLAIAVASLQNGTPPYLYEWSNGFIGDTAYNLGAGTYFIYAKDYYYCGDTINLNVTHPDSINPGFILTNPSCSGVYDGSIETEAHGGTPPYTYFWFNGSENDYVNELREGIYYLTISDSNDCIYDYEIELPEEKYCIIAFNTFTPNGDGNNDVWVIENIEQFPYSEIWVFNRNGNQVFYAKNYQNDWDGTYNGKDLPEATYYFIIEPGNSSKLLKGHVNIIR
ncbi:MAG TPA: gliding motility-associated C-terminal domain-containing protein [Bacteroidales bacterium]|nr:gliding motility-associated C-terminal domain-containing protein [Bacteroidales bacterium]